MMSFSPVNVIVPTLLMEHSKNCFDSLKHLPKSFNRNLICVTDNTNGNWARAINIGLSRLPPTGDVLILDDDVELLPETFKDFDRYYPHADMFGFKLLFPNGTIQHGGGFCDHRNDRLGHFGVGYDGDSASILPRYVVHCTASCLYIKRHVFDTIGNFTELPGVQFEDVDFSFRAIRNGLDILYIPNKAIHHESQTKKQDPQFAERMRQSYEAVMTQVRESGRLRKVIDEIQSLREIQSSFLFGQTAKPS